MFVCPPFCAWLKKGFYKLWPKANLEEQFFKNELIKTILEIQVLYFRKVWINILFFLIVYLVFSLLIGTQAGKLSGIAVSLLFLAFLFKVFSNRGNIQVRFKPMVMILLFFSTLCVNELIHDCISQNLNRVYLYFTGMLAAVVFNAMNFTQISTGKQSLVYLSNAIYFLLRNISSQSSTPEYLVCIAFFALFIAIGHWSRRKIAESFIVIMKTYSKEIQILSGFKSIIDGILPEPLLVLSFKPHIGMKVLYANAPARRFFSDSSQPASDIGILESIRQNIHAPRLTYEESTISPEFTVSELGFIEAHMLNLIKQSEEHDKRPGLFQECTRKLLAHYSKLDNSGKPSILALDINMGRMVWQTEDNAILLSFNNVTEAQRFSEINCFHSVKNDLLNNLSHHLKTPLNSIIGPTQMAIDCSDFLEVKQLLRLVLGSAKTLMLLINDFLDISVLAKEELKLCKEKFDLIECLREVSDIVQYKAKEKGLDYIFIKPKHYEIPVFSDRMRLQQILMNMLSFSCKFTEKGFIKLEVCDAIARETSLQMAISQQGTGGIHCENLDSLECDEIDQSAEFITIKITDSGEYFPIESKLRSAEKETFAENDDDLLEGKLSLSVSQKIAKLLTREGAGIQIRGNEKSLTLLKLRDPRITNSMSPNSKNGVPSRLSMNLTTDLMAKQKCLNRVLIVDDDIINVIVLKNYLKRYDGAIIDTAKNGAEALEKISLASYDLILMDLNMPVMGGIEATKRIKSITKKIVVIAVSANLNDRNLQLCTEAGFDDYLPKPIFKELFYEKMNRYYVESLKI